MTRESHMNPSRAGQRPRTSNYRLASLKRAVNEMGEPTIDGRTALGKALVQWRAQLIEDLGGQEVISTQQAALVDLAVKSKLILDSIDNWVLSQASLVNQRKRTLLPVVRERTQLADSLARYLIQLGLERRVKGLDLAAQLAQFRLGRVPKTDEDVRESGRGDE